MNYLPPYDAGAHKAGFQIIHLNKIAKLSGDDTDSDAVMFATLPQSLVVSR